MNNIKYLRKTRKMSIQRLGDAIGFSRPFISFMESGRRPVSRNACSRIADFFSVTEKFVIGEEEAGIIVHLQETEDEPGNRMKNITYLTVEQYESIKEQGAIYEKEIAGTKPSIYRFFNDTQNSESAEMIVTRASIENQLARMDKAQLEKTLLLIKEVIIK